MDGCFQPDIHVLHDHGVGRRDGIRGSGQGYELRGKQQLQPQRDGHHDRDRAARPTAPSVTATSTTSLSVSWTAPDDGGSTITGYTLRYRESSTSNWTTVPGITSTSGSLSSLEENTEYDVQVRATNSVGNSNYSPAATATTSNTAPSIDAISGSPTTVDAGAVVTLTATVTDGDDITYAWTSSPGGTFAAASQEDTTWFRLLMEYASERLMVR